ESKGGEVVREKAISRPVGTQMTVEDLFRIRTLGFRGEALPSIASVSRMTVQTATAESAHGWLVESKGGEVVREEAISRPVGTQMTVE
ncbi:hypothetical protein ACXWOQ_09390, partial [Streptococcus pyogenes]